MSTTFVLLSVFAYFVGAIPFGLIWGRLFSDVDVRAAGSGNIGATNVNRLLGRKLGAATLLSDVLKAVFPVVLGKFFLESNLEIAIVGFLAIIGHCFPIYLNFKGGKGVATGLGVTLAIAWPAGLAALLIWLIVYRLSKVSALSALIAFSLVPIMVFLLQGFQVGVVFVLITVVIFIRHRENIERMKKGKEFAAE